jgi:hypothetical protein
MTPNNNENKPETSHEFYCNNCDYGTSKKSNYDTHCLTLKHLKTTNNNEIKPKTSQKIYACEFCEKKFNDRAGLWRHNKKCNTTEKILENNISLEVILELIKDNKELKQLVIEQSKAMQQIAINGTHNNTTTNSHNKTFNLQFFLNETCKDAMNIMDFVESIQLQLSDLEKVGEIGYVDGISNIIVKNLKALDITQRPLHCADKKREVLYVKDEDKWEKQDDENMKLKKVIKKVTDKNMRLIPKYREKYPDCNKSISRHSDQYNKIVVESMGGSGDNDDEKASKIIKNITKQVLVEKEQYIDTL